MQIAFGASYCINLALSVLVAFVLAAACFAPAHPNPNTLIALCIFVALFILLTVYMALYRFMKSCVCLVVAAVMAVRDGFLDAMLRSELQVMQFLCVAFIAFALFANERTVPVVAFREDPLRWVEGTLARASMRVGSRRSNAGPNPEHLAVAASNKYLWLVSVKARYYDKEVLKVFNDRASQGLLRGADQRWL